MREPVETPTASPTNRGRPAGRGPAADPGGLTSPASRVDAYLERWLAERPLPTNLREAIMSIIRPVQESHLLFQEQLREVEATISLVGESATLAMETIVANGACIHKCTSDESDWSLMECEEC